MKTLENIQLPRLPINKKLVIVIGLSLVAFGILVSVFNTTAEAGWIDTGWYFRKKLTIDSSKVSGTANFTNFPVVVQRTDSDLQAHAQSDGDDILFTNSDGTTQLDHEIESYDSTTGTLVAWVEIDTLDYNDDTVIYMYYGNPNASNQENVTGTWPAKYEAVWHMSESSGSRSDSTDGNLDLTENGTGGIPGVTGKIGDGGDFEDGDTDYLSLANASAGALNVGANDDFTLMAWINMENVTQGDHPVAGKWDSTTTRSYSLANASWGSYQRAQARFSSDGSTDAYIIRNDTFGDMYVNTWYHVVMTFDSSSDIECVFVNNTSDCRSTAGDAYNSSADFLIGARYSLTTFDGIIDEVVFISEVLSADELTTYYNSTKEPETFFSETSAPESLDDPAAHWKFDEGVDNTCPGGEDACDSTNNGHHGTATGYGGSVSSDTGFATATAYGDDYSQWSTPSNSTTSNDAYTTATSNTQRQDFYDFGFYVPPGATIDGIEVELEASKCSFTCSDTYSITTSLSWDGGSTYSNTKSTAFLTTTDTTYTQGGSADTWGRTWSAEEFSNTNFRLRLQAAIGAASILEGSTLLGVDGQYRPIETFSAGDEILSYDTSNEVFVTNTIDKLDPYPVQEIVVINNELRITDDELIWAKTSGSDTFEWVLVSALEIGDVVLREDGNRNTYEQTVNTIEYEQGDFTVYSIETAKPHNNYWIDMYLLDPPGSGLGVDLLQAKVYYTTDSGADWQGNNLCMSGGCLYLDGTDDQVQIDDPIVTQYPFSMSAWIRTGTAGGSDTVISVGDISTNNSRFKIEVDSNGKAKLHARNTTVDEIVSNTSVNDNRWHYVSAVFASATDRKLYVDGRLENTDTSSVSFPSGADTVRIGNEVDNTPNEYYEGFIDEAKIYPTALSESLIKSNFVRGAGPRGSSAVFGANDEARFNDGLVGYWKMDDDVSGDGQTLVDSSGNGNDGTTDNSADGSLDCTVAGKYGLGCDFDGDDDDIELTDILDAENESLTVVAWFNTDITSTKQGIVVKNQRNDGQEGYGLLIDSDDTVYVSTNFDGNSQKALQQSNQTISNGEWHQIAMVIDRDSNQVLGYLDGTNDGWQNGASGNDITGYASMDTAIELQFASAESGVWNFDGLIDEVRIYKRALSPTEIEDLYEWAPGPTAYWDLNENTGSSIVFDKSGNGNNGNMNSLTENSWVTGTFGSALDFDGAADYIETSSTTIFDTSLPYTVSMWVYPDNHSGSQAFFAKDENLAIYLNSSGVLYACDDSSCFADSVNTSGSLAQGAWNHIAVVHEGSGNFILYIDAIDDTSDGVGWSSNTDDNVYIGVDDTVDEFYFDGKIDDIRVYDYARTQVQVTEDMNGGHPIGGSPIGSQTARWKFDDMNGDTAEDHVSTYDGDLAGSAVTCPQAGTSDCPVWEYEGWDGGALDFDGTDDWVDSSLASNTSSTLSMATWFYSHDAGSIGDTTSVNQFFISQRRSGSNPRLGIGIDNDRLAAYWHDGSGNTIEGNTVLSANTWYHATLTYDGSDVRIYLNGQLEATGSESSMTAATSDTFVFGDANEISSEPYDGLLDEVQIFSSVLDIDEIRLVMNANASINFGTGVDEKENLSGGAGNPPIGYWPMDENQLDSCENGTDDACDMSGNEYDAVMNGTPTAADWVNGKYGSALDFDGTDDNLDPGTLSSSTVYTVAGWYKLDATGSRNILHGFATTNSDVNALIYYDNAGEDCLGYLSWSFDCYGATGLGAELTDGDWHHVVYTYNNNDFASNKLWFDGIEQSVSQVVGTSSNHTLQTQFDIAARGDGNANWEWDGQIDDVKVWDYELNASQVAYEYNRGAPVGWWRFDECSGTTANDASGNGNNGTITIGATGSNTSAGTCSSGTSTEAWNNGTTGKRNASLDFDGTDDYVLINDSDEISFGAGENFSFLIWANVVNNQSNDSKLLEKKQVGLEAIVLDGNGGVGSKKVQFSVRDSNSNSNHNIISTSDVFDTGQWHHIAGVKDGNELRLYINGILEDSDNSVTFTGDWERGDVRIGTSVDGGSRYTEGKLDDVRVYNYALSEEQVRNVMNHGAVWFE